MNELLYGDIANRIEQKIMTKEFEVTHKLPSEREMALQFDVSRNVVREAIKLLRAKGLVEIKPGKGVYVTKPKEEIVTETFKRVLKSNEVTKMDILDVREELEIIIIKKAVAKATKDCIKKLNRIYEEMDKRKHNVFSFIEKDAEFHLALAKSTQNNVFYVLIHSFFSLTEGELFKITTYTPSSVVDAQKHHRCLIQAIEQRNEKLAVSTIQAHMGLLRQEIMMLTERGIIKE